MSGLSNWIGDGVISRKREHRGEKSLGGWGHGVKRRSRSVQCWKAAIEAPVGMQREKFSRRLTIGAWGSGEIGREI